jgi:hypothetical protein
MLVGLLSFLKEELQVRKLLGTVEPCEPALAGIGMNEKTESGVAEEIFSSSRCILLLTAVSGSPRTSAAHLQG